MDYSAQDKEWTTFVLLDGTRRPHMAHSFEGKVEYPWKTETFSKTYPLVGVLDWILIDEAGSCMWIESNHLHLTPAAVEQPKVIECLCCAANSFSLQKSILTPLSTVYDLPSGDISEFSFESPGKGKLEMRLVYSPRENRTTLWELTFAMRNSFLNSWFATSY